jgi:hypothetical protein
VVVHESTVVDRWDLRVVDGIPATSPERTLLDLGAVVGPSLVELAVDDALRRQLVSRETLRGVLGRLGRSGRNGAGVLRRVLSLRDPSVSVPESFMETRLLQLLRRHGVPEPEPQYEVYDAHGTFVARVDAAYPEARVAIEYESLQYHSGSQALLRDSDRRNRLIAADWTVVMVTINDARGGLVNVARAIRRALASATRV